MSGPIRVSRIAAIALPSALGVAAAAAQVQQPGQQPPAVVANSQPTHSLGQNAAEIPTINAITGSSGSLLEVPLVRLTPGGVSVEAGMANPMANDPESAERGMQYFKGFNCVGCHAPNGAGGMGLSLSNSVFKFGNDPAHVYLVISHGAPLGMPSWGAFLPDSAIWDLVSYIQSISKEPTGPWGRTASKTANLPPIEQVPAEFNQTTTPWTFVEPFSFDQKPTQAPSSTAKAAPDIPPDSSGG
jgi:cytochrome c oxidase cbb3-type subunit III